MENFLKIHKTIYNLRYLSNFKFFYEDGIRTKIRFEFTDGELVEMIISGRVLEKEEEQYICDLIIRNDHTERLMHYMKEYIYGGKVKYEHGCNT